ncbi:MAG: type II toxin-antitoxin system VapC family toxin [Angustibacter sp.]
MIVLDASAAIEWLLGRPLGQRVADRLADPEQTIHAPQLLPVEVTQVLRRHVMTGSATARRADQALTDLADLGVAQHDHDPLIPRIWQLRGSLTAYDAAYISLAEVLDAPLVTIDGRLARTGGHRAVVDVVGR